MSSKSEKFSKAIDHSIQKELAKRSAVLDYLTDKTDAESSTSSVEQSIPDNSAGSLSMKEDNKTTDKKMENEPVLDSTTGADSGEYDSIEKEFYKKYSPNARSLSGNDGVKNAGISREEKKNFKPFVKERIEDDGEEKMKKVILLIAGVLGIGLLLYYWKPWVPLTGGSTNIVFSQMPFLTDQTPELGTNFPKSTTIFYKIKREEPLHTDALVFRIFKLDAADKETLHREEILRYIDPNSSELVHALRADYFALSGKYLVRLYLSTNREAQPETEEELDIIE